MICPFRVGAEFTYIPIKDKDGNEDYLQKEQRTVFPPCYKDECPYYNYAGTCRRAEDD